MQIQTKLIIALSLLGTVLCLSLYVFMQWSFDRGLVSYINEQEKQNTAYATDALADLYKDYDSWDYLIADKRHFHDIMRSTMRSKHLGPGPNHRERPHQRQSHLYPEVQRKPPSPHRLSPPQRDSRAGPNKRLVLPALFDADKTILIGRPDPSDELIPITVNAKIVGWLTVPKPRYPIKSFNLSMRQNLDIAFAMLLVVLAFLVLFVGIPLSRHIVIPLKKLTDATHALSLGNFDTQFNQRRRDEIGQLGRDLQTLNDTLKENESSRRRWIADISHELRTPLSITLGEIEAMLEDIRPINKTNLHSVKQEVEQLNRLVNDLYELSNAEIGALRYHKARINLNDAVQHGVQRFEDLFQSRAIQLQYNIPNEPIWVHADVQRLNQLMNNLMTNELKYASKEAILRISLSSNATDTILIVEDSGPGVSDEHIPKLFEHIYRVENSRNRKTGGSGLGLAICKKIIVAHEGSIHASHSPLGGLKLEITFPNITFLAQH